MHANKIRVLLIYPTFYRVTGIPVGLATLTGVLRQHDYDVRVFDTAFYPSQIELSQDEFRSKVGMSKEIVNQDRQKDNTTDMDQDLLKLVSDFSPDVVGVTVLEPTYHIGIRLTRLVKEHFPDVFIIAGGVFPTLSPDIVLSEPSIDAICIGEGETSLLSLCERLSNGGDARTIPGIWVNWKGKTYKNGPSALHELNALPHPDYSLFDSRLFYKPMQGRLYKMINIETSRGCPYSCTYCAAPKLQDFFRKNKCGRYYRKLSKEAVVDQIHCQIDQYQPEFIYFSSETFLGMTDEEFRHFTNAYAEIRIPFWFQTRIETITEQRLQALKDVGMSWLTIGLEHGNEEFRRSVLKRKYSNTAVIECVRILRKLDLGASINNIMGFPMETRDLVLDTIQLNRDLWKVNPKIECNIFMFTPYRGCELYDFCKSKDLIKDTTYLDSSVASDQTVLDFPDQWKQELQGLYRTFNMYIRLKEKHYPQIHVAEQHTQVGDQAFAELSELLKQEIVEKG